MLVDASCYPAPAMWEGLMFIAVAIHAVYINSDGPDGKMRSRKSVARATCVLGIFAVGSLIAFLIFSKQ